jgi:hypothetical protein
MIAERCTQGQVLKLTSMYFAMIPSRICVEWSSIARPSVGNKRATLGGEIRVKFNAATLLTRLRAFHVML